MEKYIVTIIFNLEQGKAQTNTMYNELMVDLLSIGSLQETLTLKAMKSYNIYW
jgi:hypothetical protein